MATINALQETSVLMLETPRFAGATATVQYMALLPTKPAVTAMATKMRAVGTMQTTFLPWKETAPI